eukprot:TRINITY_DN70921_c0_g1_i1.p2 TRINITY_DN70921_c0_g1~~TRINITY_DN70921_c0_g1_i1.p2  ORF type:complete len:267 (+),score=99.43 TRINITY_DN70921_c0_g1_i1:80-802(+)
MPHSKEGTAAAVPVEKEGQEQGFEPLLHTAPSDPRVKQLHAVLARLQRVSAAGVAALTVDDWAGAWVQGYRDLGWGKFLEFNGVPAAAHEAVVTHEDRHWYKVGRESLTMRHHIAAQGLDKLYGARLDGEWRQSPYSEQTSAHWSEDQRTRRGLRWRNRWLQYPVSMRAEWENRHGDAEDVTSITVMERHLVAPDVMNFHVWVYRAGGDPDQEADCLVPRTGTTYVRCGSDLPPEPAAEY